MDSSSSSSHMDEDSVDGSEREFEYDLDEVDDEEAAEEEDEDVNEYDEEEEDEEEEEEEEPGLPRDLSATLSGVVNQFRLLHRPQIGALDAFPEPNVDPTSIHRLPGLPRGLIGFNIDPVGMHLQEAEAIFSSAWDAAMNGVVPQGFAGFNFDPISSLPSRMRYGGHGHGIPSVPHMSSALHALEPGDRVHPVLRRRRHNPDFSAPQPSYRIPGNAQRFPDPSVPDPYPSQTMILEAASGFVDVVRRSGGPPVDPEQGAGQFNQGGASRFPTQADSVSPPVPTQDSSERSVQVENAMGDRPEQDAVTATSTQYRDDSRSFVLDTPYSHRISAGLQRRYDPSNAADEQGAEFAALAEDGLLTGLGDAPAPPRTNSLFSFLSKSNKDDAPYAMEVQQHWNYDPPTDSTEERWLAAPANRSQTRDHHPLSRSGVRSSSGGESQAGPGMDQLRDEVVKYLERSLRVSRDAQTKLREFKDLRKQKKAQAESKAAQQEEHEENKTEKEVPISDPGDREREGGPQLESVTNAGQGTSAEDTSIVRVDADPVPDSIGGGASLDRTMDEPARDAPTPNTVEGGVSGDTRAGVEQSAEGIAIRAVGTDGSVQLSPARDGEENIAQIVEVRAAAAGVSLDAPASEDPNVVASALASTGIDPTFLAALPDEMRDEVLTQMFQQLASSHPVDMGPEATSSTILSQDFLIALPPALRAEVLQQEVTFRSRGNLGSGSNDAAQAGDNSGSQSHAPVADASGDAGAPSRGPADADVATVLATLTRELREEIFLTSSESFLASLPVHMAAEARNVRQRELGRMRHSRDLGLLRFAHGMPRARQFRSENEQPSEAIPPPTTWACNDGVWLRLAPSAETEPAVLCGDDALAALVKLLHLQSSQYGKTLLYHVLAHLSKRGKARRQLLKLLFDAVDGRGKVNMNTSKSIAIPGDNHTELEAESLDIERKSMVCGNTDNASAAVVVRRALELLTNLCKNEAALAESVVMVPGAHKHDLEDKSCCALTVDGFSPVTRLVGLLSEPLFLRSSTHQEQLLLLLSTVCSAMPEASVPASAVSKANGPDKIPGGEQTSNPERDAATGDTSTGELEDSSTVRIRQPLRAQPADSSGVSATNSSQEVREAVEDKNTEPVELVVVPVRYRVPALRSSDVRALTSVLLQEGPSDRTYQRATSVLGQFGALPANRELELEAMSDCASGLASVISAAFKSFVATLPTPQSSDTPALANAIQDFSMVASPDELKLLRVLKAIAVLFKGSPAASSSIEEDATDENNELEVSHLGYSSSVQDLWSSLDTVLSVVHGEHSAGSGEKGVNVSDNDIASVGRSQGAAAGINTGPVSRVGGKVYSLSPILARLSPVIESFFVYHGPTCPEPDRETLKESEKSRQSSESGSLQSPGSSGRMMTSPPMEVSKGQTSYDRDLGIFIERHRDALNAILRVNPQLLDGSFRPALRHAHAIDFDNKKAYFRGLIRKRSSEAHAGTIRITVRRDRVFDDSYHQLRSHSAEEMKGRLHVQFNGEEGIDAGGVTREWYVILARQIFDPNYALFCRSAAKAATYQPNKSSAINREHLDNFRFVGRVFGKAIYDNQLLDAYFTRAFYKHILGIKPTYHDIEAEDPEYYKSLCWILENDITDVIDETFSTEFDEFGQQQIVDLKPNGRNITVTEENKEEYVRLVSEVKLTKAISKQIASFKEGFHELIPLEDCRIFNEVELELLTSGLPDIDVTDLKANVEYTGYTPSSPQINWFWTAVSRMGQEDLARLVMFVTGTSKVPLEGFSALQGMNGPQKFQIHRASGGKDRLPSAHTCFNQLDLPEYESCDVLSERLLRAVRETEGFGFA